MDGAAYTGWYDASGDQKKILFGEGALVYLATEVKQRGDRVLLITGNTIFTKTDLVDTLRQSLDSSLAGIFAATKPHSPRRTVLDAAAQARSITPDVIISLGGGSATDTAKAVRLACWMNIVEEADFDKAYQRLRENGEWERPESKMLPQISMPTTLVAAEFTPGMGITNEATHGKQVFSHPDLKSDVIILDPVLTIYTPPVLWFSTGVKALEHALAKLSAVDPHPVVDATATLATQILGEQLLISFTHPDDMRARGQLQVGSWLAMFGLGTSSGMRMGLSHALGRQIGGVTGASHGVISSVILPWALEYNAPFSGPGLVLAAQALGVKKPGMTTEEAAKAVATAVRSLVAKLDLPTHLRDIGVSQSDLPLIAERTMNDFAIGANPRPITSAEEVLALLEEAW